MANREVPFSELVGKVLSEITGKAGDEQIDFFTANPTPRCYRLFHIQDCCECVEVADVCGDWSDLVGVPILLAECNSWEGPDQEPPMDSVPVALRKVYEPLPSPFDYGTQTWSFYRLATIKGAVTIRWYGSSNGYYSEKVTFVLLNGVENGVGYL